MSVNIEWVALSCLRIWRDGGPAIVTDPCYPPEVGMPGNGQTIEGDIVITSSQNDLAHGYPKFVRGEPRVIDALEVNQQGIEAEIDDGPLITLKTAEGPGHLDGQGRFEPPTDNAVYAFQVGGLWILHLGDVGYGLGVEELAPFVGHCDVLLPPVGQTNTISLQDLDFLIYHLKPRWIIPVHYKLPPVATILQPLDDFLVRRPQDPLLYARTNTVTLPLELPATGHPAIIVLDPSGYEPA
jgi:hypothetical protein